MMSNRIPITEQQQVLNSVIFDCASHLIPEGDTGSLIGDGYFTDGTLKICTDNFSKDEVLRLINVLDVKFGIGATINKRTNPDGAVKWRIRISKSSMDKLITLVSPYFIPEMRYKLGLADQSL